MNAERIWRWLGVATTADLERVRSDVAFLLSERSGMNIRFADLSRELAMAADDMNELKIALDLLENRMMGLKHEKTKMKGQITNLRNRLDASRGGARKTGKGTTRT